MRSCPRDACGAIALQRLALEQAHPHHVVVAPVGEELLDQHALAPEARVVVDADGARVVDVDQQVQLVEVEHAEGVVDRQPRRGARVAVPLLFRRDHDQELGAPMQVVDLDQFDQPHALVRGILDDETPFGLVVDVLAIQLFQLDEGLVRFLEPVAHHVAVVVEHVDEMQVAAFQRPQRHAGSGIVLRIHAATLLQRRDTGMQPIAACRHHTVLPGRSIACR